MEFDFEKIKQNLSADKLKGFLAKQGSKSPAALGQRFRKKAWLANFQQGLLDIRVVLEEGKFSLFVKQLVVLLAVFLLVRYGYKNLATKKAKIKDDIESLQIQQANKSDYLENKKYLLRLEPLFPDVEQKGTWMLARISDIFEKHKIQANIDGNVSENAQQFYIVGSQPATFTESFKRTGELIADIENGDDLFRITNFMLTKQTDKENLGSNAVTIQFNTVFPKNKYAATLFKDYAAQMEQIKKEQEQAAAKTAAQPAEKQAQ